jgi:hypothetical protein
LVAGLGSQDTLLLQVVLEHPLEGVPCHLEDLAWTVPFAVLIMSDVVWNSILVERFPESLSAVI